jgi:hypothetical protein
VILLCTNVYSSFVSRANPKDAGKHVILGVSGYKPKEFANQMNLNLANGWGIVRTIVDMCRVMPDGKYVLVKVRHNELSEIWWMWLTLANRIQTRLSFVSTRSHSTPSMRNLRLASQSLRRMRSRTATIWAECEAMIKRVRQLF